MIRNNASEPCTDIHPCITQEHKPHENTHSSSVHCWLLTHFTDHSQTTYRWRQCAYLFHTYESPLTLFTTNLISESSLTPNSSGWPCDDNNVNTTEHYLDMLLMITTSTDDHHGTPYLYRKPFHYHLVIDIKYSLQYLPYLHNLPHYTTIKLPILIPTDPKHYCLPNHTTFALVIRISTEPKPHYLQHNTTIALLIYIPIYPKLHC